MHGPVAALNGLAWLAGGLALAGIASVIAAAGAVERFARRPRRPPTRRPPVTVFKPLYGDEPRLEEALTSICRQSYPDFQIVFGVREDTDPALRAVANLRARFPEQEIVVVVDPTLHGRNRKISNLINMFPSGRHDILVFSDSDLHVPPDYLERIVTALEEPSAGLATTICLGLPTGGGVPARLGGTHISHCFVPGALLSRMLGREDCLGTTMALHRDVLARVGGLHALVMHLADDNVLGQRVHRIGLKVMLADTVPMTAVPCATPRALWMHELRWARTIGALQPALFAVSAMQYPIFWALLASLLTAGAAPALVLFALAWLLRAAAALRAERVLRAPSLPAAPVPLWLLPLRDLLTVAEIAASYFGSAVIWRGHAMTADDGRPLRAEGVSLGEITKPLV